MVLPMEVGKSPTLKGIRGMLAIKDIKKGELLEKCPVIVMTAKQEKSVDETSLVKYTYEWTGTDIALVLGYGSLYNHSFQPNADYRKDIKNENMVFRAIKDIKQGEEIFISYKFDPNSKKPFFKLYTDYDAHRKESKKSNR